MAIDFGLIQQEDPFEDTDEKKLVNLLEKYDHRFDKDSIKKLQLIAAEFCSLKKVVNDKAELIAFIKEAEYNRYILDKARRNKLKFDNDNKLRKEREEKAKSNFYYTKGGCRIKKSSRVRVSKSVDSSRVRDSKPVDSSRVRDSKPDDWRRCDAMKNGRVCRKWQKLHQTEFNNRELPYRCKKCRKANRDTDPDFKPIGSDDE
jgi:hypothetical protein